MRFVQTGGSPEKQQLKGGEPAWRVFNPFIVIGKIIKEKMTKPQHKNSPKSHGVNLLIRTAGWVREKGQVRPISEDPVLEESIGILFNILRRQKKITLENLAKMSGLEIEELIAFEAGLLPRLRVCEILPDLTRSIGIAYEELLHKAKQNPHTFFQRLN